MKQGIFIDTDVFLDTILQRKPYAAWSDCLINLCERNEINGYTSSLVIANLHYILRKVAGHKKALQAITKIRSFVEVLPFTDKEIAESISAGFNDFEDGVQYFIALNHHLESLVTRNVRDFRKASSIKILSPEEFVTSRNMPAD